MLLFPAVLRCRPLSVDFSRSGIWGKLGTGVQGICLKSCAKFPPSRTMCSRDAIRPQPLQVLQGLHLYLYNTLVSPFCINPAK